MAEFSWGRRFRALDLDRVKQRANNLLRQIRRDDLAAIQELKNQSRQAH